MDLDVDGTLLLWGFEDVYMMHENDPVLLEKIVERVHKNEQFKFLYATEKKVYDEKAKVLQDRILAEGASEEILNTLSSDLIEYGRLPVFFYLFALAYKSIGNLEL